MPRPELSIVIPYHNRYLAMLAWMKMYELFYPDKNYEVIIIDDGSDTPLQLDSFNVHRIDRPPGAMNPCVPINMGVSKAKANLICLTSCETLHTTPLLPEMIKSTRIPKKYPYVSAAVREDPNGFWYQHSKERPLRLPFLVVFPKRLFEIAGGYDPAYRMGHGHDDTDFVNKLKQRSSVKFIDRDDLLGIHYSSGQNTQWSRDLMDLNKLYYDRKWGSQ